MDLMQILDMVLHVDKMLGTVIEQYGTLVYFVLFAIVFCETAFVIFPFLPGDSLLFIAGAFCATGAMNPWLLIILLLIASISGNTINYWIGSLIGHKVLEKDYRWIDRDAIRKTHDFYEKHGGKAVIFARFVPIVRTFAPFVAGVGSMTYNRFIGFSVLASVLWINICVWAGYFFGRLEIVKNNFSLVVIAIIGISLIPILIGIIKQQFSSK